MNSTADKTMVTYVTQVVAQLPHDTVGQEDYSLAKLHAYIEDLQQRLARIEKMMAVLEAHGFKLLRDKYKIIAYANDVEAYAAKQILHEAGFSNHEFSIHLDYTRKWGVL